MLAICSRYARDMLNLTTLRKFRVFSEISFKKNLWIGAFLRGKFAFGVFLSKSKAPQYDDFGKSAKSRQK